jgi:integrase/recombinase XerD
MDSLPIQFENYLIAENKSLNTIKGYSFDLASYFSWFQKSFGKLPEKLFRENVLDYKSYLLNIERLNGRTVNHHLSTLKKFNEFLIFSKKQEDQVVQKRDMQKIQQDYASPTISSELEVKAFIQKVLENEPKRDYALVTLLAYTGLRISEALDIKRSDFNLQSGECIIRSGKGGKQRIVPLNAKVINALSEYLQKERSKNKNSEIEEFLFLSRVGKRLDRSVVNEMFKRHSEKITPHQLRHFFCTNALEKGLGIHEVANIAGHSNIHTTMIYTNPDREKLKGKMELL